MSDSYEKILKQFYPNSEIIMGSKDHLTPDELVRNQAWADLGEVIDELTMLLPKGHERRQIVDRVQNIRGTLFVPGKHHEVQIRPKHE